MTSRLFVGSAGAVLAITAFVPGVATAQVPDFDMHWQVDNGSVADINYNWALFGEDADGDGTPDNPIFGEHDVPGASLHTGWRYAGTIGGELIEVEPGVFKPRWELSWNCVFNDNVGGVATGGGAFVTANIVVTNNDFNTANFGLTMTLPTTIDASKNIFERGSATGTVTDNTFDSATISSPGLTQMYTPRIDGVDETAGYLYPVGGGGGFSESALFGSTTNLSPQSFGIPNPVAAAATEITASIGIRLSFDLTGGDSASMTSIFEVLIPGPGGLPVLAAMGLLGGRRRRRR